MLPRYSPFLPPNSVLLPSCSLLLAMILFFAVPTTYLGQGSLPAHSLCSQLVPSGSAHSPLAPSRSSLAPLTFLAPLAPLAPLSLPSHPLTPNGQTRLVVYYTIFRCPHYLCGGKGRDGSEGVRGERERSEREQGE